MKKEFSSSDASPQVLYARTNPNSDNVVPIIVTTGGALQINSGLNIPNFDYVDFTNLSNILFKSGGASGTVVATISIVGTTMTRT
jgi:hypothetical protein